VAEFQNVYLACSSAKPLATMLSAW
jgi:hypothetical protein